MQSDCLTEALKYAERGWYVVPDHAVTESGGCTCQDPLCKTPGKHPRINRESEHAYLRRVGSRNADEIKRWWEIWPDSNVAIVCGEKSNLVAIDVDPRNNGFESLKKLESIHGPVSSPATSRTGGGGAHILFAHPKTGLVRNRIGLLPGIDVKADGGRIVAPPSNHASGNRYQWQTDYNLPIPRLPAWLHRLIQEEKGTGTRKKLIEEDPWVDENRNEFSVIRDVRRPW